MDDKETGIELLHGGCLSQLEQFRLADLEQVVEQGLDAFMVVGQALLEIRDARLYRETHGSFEAYLDERWGVSRSRGYQLIDAARVTKALSTGVDLDPPANEAQARALVPLAGDEQAMVEAWRDLRAHHDGRVTADLVRQAVSERMAREAFCREPITASEPLLPETPSESRLPPRPVDCMSSETTACFAAMPRAPPMSRG